MTIAVDTPLLRLYQGHVLEQLREMPADSVDCVVTSPPYWGLRAYSTDPVIWGGDPACEHEWANPQRGRVSGGGDRPPDNKAARGAGSPDSPSVRHTCARCHAWRGELGLEPTPGLFVDHIVEIFREVRRVMRKRGTLWLNLGDTYAAGPSQGSERGTDTMLIDRQKQIPRGTGRWGGGQRWAPGVKPKDLVGIPWRVAFALQADGWYLRSDIIWAKPNPMPESVIDRPTRAHEYIFLLTKTRNYFYDQVAGREALAESSIERINQPGFDQQTGGEKDYGTNGVNPNRSARNALENFAVHRRAPVGWNREHVGSDLVGRWDGKLDEERVAALPGRNSRSVWQIATQPYPSAHFATFPEELPRRCISAGSSGRGVCPTCGAPWQRVVERGNSEHHCRPGCNHDPDQSTWGTAGWAGYNEAKAPYGGFYPTAVATAVWAPTCAHRDATSVPAVVLDPFAGSGTTLAVANALGRRAVGIELNASYVGLIRERCAAVQMADWNAGEPIRPREQPEAELDYTKGHASLFGEETPS